MEMLFIPLMAIMAALIVMLIFERLAVGRRHEIDRDWWRRALANSQTKYINIEQITLNMHQEVETMREEVLVLRRLTGAAVTELRKVRK